ncbi:Glycosyl transferase, group 2 family protein [Hyella patelloides LEGE 07179]|uniref:Glycosyl transferase, group 2 family protein n=1 Tax=Hyella patelloides LEGE 07179 TaxID=945734 RepID=A0A563VJ44_9CYAN|nr:glycosyltransferase [Hyella patelloides]VEP11476.1 Glycosyl transferase, group 2 family protein [Hyella patelloides LEGE 07179]
MSNSQVTIVVVPRERYQFARESLESLYENTAFGFDLVYVDNNSPTQLRRYLETQADLKGFKLVRSEHYLSPNQARNFGLRNVNSKYVVFVDNDVVFAPNWLTALVDCTEATGATVVGSLVCQYQPFHEIVHCAGGEYMSAEEYAEFAQGKPHPSDRDRWQINEKTPYQNQRVEVVRDRLHREPTGFVEFHAMLVRTEIFEQIGMLDEEFPCTKEYLDFCMSVTRAGGTVYLEPSSVVTFLTHPPAPALQWSDLPYFMLRWSDAWELSNLLHFQQKWNLVESKYFQRRYKKLGIRRQKAFIDPLMTKFTFLGNERHKWLKKSLIKLEKRLNRYVTNRYQRLTGDLSQANSPLKGENKSVPIQTT